MTNLFALSLIITTLTAAGLWSPPPPPQNVIVKEGHRVVVVEYDDQGQHNTKVSISSEPDQDPQNSERHRTKDLICDVYGKCKHKVASALEKAKVMVSETAQEAHDAGEAVTDAFHEAKDKLKEGAKETLEKAKSREEAVVEGAERLAMKTGEKIKTGENRMKQNLMGIVDRGFKVMNYSFGHLGFVMDVLGLLGFTLALGMGVWVTFISSYVLASVLPRQQLGVVQSKIYPVYFKAMASCIGMALLGHIFNRTEWKFPNPKNGEVVQGYVLVAALLMTLANSLYLEPRASKVMFERLKMEKEEGRGMEDIGTEPSITSGTTTTTTQVVDREVVKSRLVGLNKRLKKLNSYSSLLNLLTLMALTCHLVYLSLRFCHPC